MSTTKKGSARVDHSPLRSLDGDEVHLRMMRDGLGQQRLPAAGRSVQQHPGAWLEAKGFEALRLEHRLHDRQLQLRPDLRMTQQSMSDKA